MEFNRNGKAIGFRDGDVLISADGVPFERYGGDMLTSVVDVPPGNSTPRWAKEVSVYIPRILWSVCWLTVYVLPHSAIRMLLMSICANRPAALAGLQARVTVLAIGRKEHCLFRF